MMSFRNSRTNNAIITKQRKTQQKVASFQQSNDEIIDKYGSFDALRKLRYMYR